MIAVDQTAHRWTSIRSRPRHLGKTRARSATPLAGPAFSGVAPIEIGTTDVPRDQRVRHRLQFGAQYGPTVRHVCHHNERSK